MLYTLMHRDIPVMDLELDEYSNIAVLGTIYHAEHLPLGTYNGINAEKRCSTAGGQSVPFPQAGKVSAMCWRSWSCPPRRS